MISGAHLLWRGATGWRTLTAAFIAYEHFHGSGSTRNQATRCDLGALGLYFDLSEAFVYLGNHITGTFHAACDFVAKVRKVFARYSQILQGNGQLFIEGIQQLFGTSGGSR